MWTGPTPHAPGNDRQDDPATVPAPPPPGPPPGPGDVPWHAQNYPPSPGDYTPAHDYTTPMPPGASGETSFPLSPEPWAESPIWQPPAPQRRSRKPFVLVAAGAVALALVASAIVFWPSGSDGAAGTVSKTLPPTGPAPGESGAPGGGTPPTEPGTGSDPQNDAAFQQQADQVDALLEDMGTTRDDLVSVVVDEDCSVSGMQRILGKRRTQLEQARALDVSAFTDGTPMKNALVRALTASAESNERYVAVAPGCPPEEQVSDVNGRATAAKNEFIGYWTTIAARADLPVRTGDDI